MHKKTRKKPTFLLIAFFAFSYLFANQIPIASDYTTVEASHNHTVILGGQSIGVDISVDGIMILGFSDFYGEDGKKHCPAKEAGLNEGDIIVSVNGQKVSSASEFSNIVDSCNSKINVDYTRDGKKYSASITAQKSAEDGKFRLGLWARDGTTGIGTLTFIDPSTNRFGALGHGVTDADTGDLIIGKGKIYFASVNGIQKGTASNAGELQGYFISSEIGTIDNNTEMGIFGEFYEQSFTGRQVTAASRQEISTGDATIFCCIDGNDVQEFTINIEKININSYDNKSMVIKITDQDLISRTGGIVQGMSGSPVIQNGKLVGAVTHVFVNDPTRGYGIFIETMLNAAK